MADRVGFEPTSLLRDYLISSQGRYDHFDTPPGVFHPKIVSRKKERTFGENFAPLSPGGIRKAL